MENHENMGAITKESTQLEGIPKLSALENAGVGGTHTNNVAKQSVEFAYSVNHQIYARAGRNPTGLLLEAPQSLIEEALRMVEADELVERNRRSTDSGYEIHVDVLQSPFLMHKGDVFKGGKRRNTKHTCLLLLKQNTYREV